MRKGVLAGVLIVWLVLPCRNVAAGDAEVLPKGRWAVNIDYRQYFPWDKRFDRHGNVEDAAADFNTELGTAIFPDLAAFEGPPFNISSPNVGTSVVSFRYDYRSVDTTIGYGITDKLSAGIRVPYIWYRNEVKARLDTTSANIGKNPAFNPAQPPGPTNPPFIPIAIGGQPLTEEDVQNLLGGGLFINGGLAVPGYGFKRFQTWEADGFGDIEAGVKYKYYQSENWRLACAGGVLFPTGEVDDPDNLVDRPLGGGAYALLLRTYHDYTGIRNLVLNGSLFYSLTFPQHEEKRIVSDPHRPISTDKERVEIDAGDILEFELSAKYRFDETSPVRGTSVGIQYQYTRQFTAKVEGSDGRRIPGLEEESGGMSQIGVVSVSYSTVPLYLKQKFPIPMDAYLAYRNRFAGTNSTFKTQYLQFGFVLYF